MKALTDETVNLYNRQNKCRFPDDDVAKYIIFAKSSDLEQKLLATKKWEQFETLMKKNDELFRVLIDWKKITHHTVLQETMAILHDIMFDKHIKHIRHVYLLFDMGLNYPHKRTIEGLRKHCRDYHKENGSELYTKIPVLGHGWHLYSQAAHPNAQLVCVFMFVFFYSWITQINVHVVVIYFLGSFIVQSQQQ